MKVLIRSLLVLAILVFVGCATHGTTGGGSASSSSSSGSSGGKMLSDSDYKRIGVKEMGNTVR